MTALSSLLARPLVLLVSCSLSTFAFPTPLPRDHSTTIDADALAFMQTSLKIPLYEDEPVADQRWAGSGDWRADWAYPRAEDWIGVAPEKNVWNSASSSAWSEQQEQHAPAASLDQVRGRASPPAPQQTQAVANAAAQSQQNIANTANNAVNTASNAANTAANTANAVANSAAAQQASEAAQQAQQAASQQAQQAAAAVQGVTGKVSGVGVMPTKVGSGVGGGAGRNGQRSRGYADQGRE